MWIQILFYEEPQQGFLEQPAQQMILDQIAQSFESPAQQMCLEKSAQNLEPTAQQMFLGQSAQSFESPAQQMSHGQPAQCFEQQVIFPEPVLEDLDTVSQEVLEEDLAKYLDEFANILDTEAETLQNEPLDLSCKGRKEITL
ncbi:hypothetical protein AVEN_256482-1 [Araneus ventricosus]|uniref:Uncharacterized protein n=1 Tax=Araneus ventricosus TaxID=182803 RepID=A0A4Y2U5V3_ARAVE|nr:hypothetical protein AVEN_256482-1 [Araneus ventricosus]